MTTLSITDARNNLGVLVNKASFKGERIAIQRNGKPAAVLVSVEDAELLAELEDRLDLDAARKAMKEPGGIHWEKVKEDLGL